MTDLSREHAVAVSHDGRTGYRPETGERGPAQERRFPATGPRVPGSRSCPTASVPAAQATATLPRSVPSWTTARGGPLPVVRALASGSVRVMREQ
jgi:hypothetical protein